MTSGLGRSPDFLAGGGELGALMRAHDWSATALGPPRQWPQSLRTVVRLALNTRHPVFIFWGPELTCLYNDAYSQTIGPERHPGALGRPGQEVWAEIWDIVGPQIAQVMSGDGATWHENHLVPITRHGRREDVWWTYSYSPVDDEAAPSGIGGVLVLCNDVTKEHRSREALRESEARFRNMADNAPVMIWTTDAAGQCTYLNQVWHDFTGQSVEQGLGMGWLDAVHPEDRTRAADIFLAATANCRPFRLDYRLRRADGAWRWAIDAAAPRVGDDGEFLGFVGSVIDITERKADEDRLLLLTREVDHRAKNALAVVQAALRLTPSDDPRSYAEAVEGRVRALARAHTLLADASWMATDLRPLLEAELAPFLAGQRAELSGPPVALPPAAAQGLGMVIHELATNAVKHGALSAARGRLVVSWAVEPRSDAQGAQLLLRWSEAGGPAIPAPPERRGFGSRVLDTTVRVQLRGTVVMAWGDAGLTCTVAIPLQATSLQGAGDMDPIPLVE